MTDNFVRMIEHPKHEPHGQQTQIGWLGQTGVFYPWPQIPTADQEPGSYIPVYMDDEPVDLAPMGVDGTGATMTSIPESFARRILELAIAEGRAAEMLECLFDGGSVTVDANSGRLCLMNTAQLTTESEWITPPEDMWQDDDDAPVGRTEREPR